mmetsp:Transcript_24613/g.38233  ORF Transcript_24613/g.38233 Transcript_24613/m.38233 type:complete len:142 (+) Transcript_24613:1628-2053(+)
MLVVSPTKLKAKDEDRKEGGGDPEITVENTDKGTEDKQTINISRVKDVKINVFLLFNDPDFTLGSMSNFSHLISGANEHPNSLASNTGVGRSSSRALQPSEIHSGDYFGVSSISSATQSQTLSKTFKNRGIAMRSVSNNAI